MATAISEQWNGLKNRFSTLHNVVLRSHRIIGIFWLLSFVITFAVNAAGEEIPGPSIIGLSFIALIITGGYLLLRPWIRGPTTVSARLKGLTSWTRVPSVVLRRTHRIAGGLFFLLLVVALSIQSATGNEPRLVLIPLVVVLLYLAISGLYLFFSPWVARYRMN